MNDKKRLNSYEDLPLVLDVADIMKQGITIQERLKDLRTELHLSDSMVELLKSGRINNRLLCEIATHEDFVTLMTDTEIYVDGVATAHFQNFNSLLEVLRGQVLSQYQQAEEDRYEKLSEQERTVLKNVMKKTPAYKDSPLSRMKRR